MAGGEKPYRVYRGGRVKGKVPALKGSSSKSRRPDGNGGFPLRRPELPKRQRTRNWRRRIMLTLTLLLVLLIAWGVTSYLAFRNGVGSANERLNRPTKAVLAPQEGLLLSQPTNILLLGTDTGPKRAGNRHSDSILLLRTDPDRRRLTYLSILRDLRVDVPGYGLNKINAAFQFGGPPLAARTVRAVTGLEINHVVIVNFATFRDLIDELGGVTVDVPQPILSNKFDCPYAAPLACERWPGWRFSKGRQHMDGRRALVYSRIRKNQLQPEESDATRAARQQQVLQAMTSRLISPRTLARLPFVGEELLEPIATDLTAGQFMQLGWVKFRAGRTIRCRLGGNPYGGDLIPDEEKFAVLQMVQGKAAPQPPLPGSLYGSGCFT